MRRSIETRMAKVERRFLSRTRGVHRYSDDELSGLIAVQREVEDSEAVDPGRQEWAADLLRREGLLP